MVTVGELIIYIALFSLMLIILANKVDLQKYEIYVSSGFVMYVPTKINELLGIIASKTKFWEKLGSILMLPTFLLFIATPLFLILNVVRGYYFELAPIFEISIIQYLRIETFLLTIPVLVVFLSFQMFIRAIYNIIDGEEVEKSGFLIIVIIMTFFAKTTNRTKKQRRIMAFSVIIIFQLLSVLVAIPMSSAITNELDNYYGESEGAIITIIFPNSPAFDSNLEVGDIVTKIRLYGSIRDTDIVIKSSSSLYRTLAQIPPGILFEIHTDAQIQITGIVPPDDVSQKIGSYIGVLAEDYKEPTGIFPLLFPFWIEILFLWIVNIGLLFSLYSLLPLPNTMGYELMEHLSNVYKFDFSDRVKSAISYSAIGLLALNVIYYVI